MTFNKLFATGLSLALTVGLAVPAFAQQDPQMNRGQELDPNFKGLSTLT
jgi:hypothetical protein